MALLGINFRASSTDAYIPVLEATPNSTLIIKEIIGLGPPDINVYIDTTATLISTYQGSRPINRELVLTLGINPNYGVGQTAADLRNQFYSMISTSVPLRLDLYFEESATGIYPSLKTTGYIRRVEPVIFSKEPEIQVTISCLSPFFSADEEILSGDDFLYQDSKIDYKGTADAGYFVEFTINEDRPAFSFNVGILDAYPYPSVNYMQVQRPVVAGDRYRIDSNPGNKSILLKRSPATWYEDITAYLTQDSSWSFLQKGVNELSVTNYYYGYTNPSFTWNQIKYTPLYWGV